MEKYKVGDIIKCEVSGVEDYGIFTKIDNDYSGLIHISEVAHSFVKDVNDFAKVGDKIFARIIEIDESKMKLSIKDIDYKNTGKINRIIESKSGFKPLKEKLPEWTREKLEEIGEQ